MENIKWLVLGIAVLMYLCVIAFQEKKVLFSSIAAVVVVILGVILPDTIFPFAESAGEITGAFQSRTYAITHSLFEIINWNVLMIYLGSMIIAALFIYSAVPSRIADAIVNSSKSTGLAIIAILAMTGIISIFVENVATVLVMAPIALSLCKKLNLNPTYFMIGLAVMSNMEGTATLVGDPPSMIFAAYAGYNFMDFFFYSGRVSIFFFIQIGLIVGCLYFYFIFSRKAKDKISLEKTPVISYFPFILLLIMIIGLAAVSFIPWEFEYLSGSYVLSLGIIGLFWYKISQKKDRKDISALIKDLDWETIFFLIGIFVVVGAIQEIGLLEDFAGFLAKVCGGSKLAAFIVILLVSVIVSGFVDNVPYIIAMLPVAGSMALSLNLEKELLMFALLIGSCLGGNLTPYGASANVVSMGILKKEGYPMKFTGWLKVAIPFTILTTSAASIVLWFVWS